MSIQGGRKVSAVKKPEKKYYTNIVIKFFVLRFDKIFVIKKFQLFFLAFKASCVYSIGIIHVFYLKYQNSYTCLILGFNNYKLLSIGDTNHSSLGVYGPAYHYGPQKYFAHFWSQNSFLNLTVSTSDAGLVVYEGLVFNWLRRQLVFCGGQQVLAFDYR